MDIAAAIIRKRTFPAIVRERYGNSFSDMTRLERCNITALSRHLEPEREREPKNRDGFYRLERARQWICPVPPDDTSPADPVVWVP